MSILQLYFLSEYEFCIPLSCCAQIFSGAVLCLPCRPVEPEQQQTSSAVHAVNGGDFDTDHQNNLAVSDKANVGVENIRAEANENQTFNKDAVRDKATNGEFLATKGSPQTNCSNGNKPIRVSLTPGHITNHQNANAIYTQTFHNDTTLQRKRQEETTDNYSDCKRQRVSSNDDKLTDSNYTYDEALNDQVLNSVEVKRRTTFSVDNESDIECSHEMNRKRLLSVDKPDNDDQSENDMELTHCDPPDHNDKPTIFSIDDDTVDCLPEIRLKQSCSVDTGESDGENPLLVLPGTSENDTGVFNYQECDEIDDDSEILCWDASEPDPFGAKSDDFGDVNEDFIETTRTNQPQSPCLSTAAKCLIAKSSDISESDEHAPNNSPKCDVCYICGSDLSKLKTGVRGRVAHMKRCASKHGNINIHDNTDFDGEFQASGGELVEAVPSQPSSGCTGKAVYNPYSKDQWHGDASSELEANKPLNESKQQKQLKANTTTQPQQSMMDKFLKAPVRSLTNVLMAGSRKLAKGKAIEEQKQSPTANGSKPRRRWGGGGWGKKTGTCPLYKRIPGTDFICDGFQYARYFLTCICRLVSLLLTHPSSMCFINISATLFQATTF